MKTEPVEIVDEAEKRFDPSSRFALFSGGDDSLVTTHMLMEHFGWDYVFHINTGTGIPETHEYVRETCDEFGWELVEYHAHDHVDKDGNPDPQIYEEMVKQHGFPGPAMHYKMFQRLKERQVQRLIRDYKEEWQDRILLGTGVYKGESDRRFKNYSDPIDRKGCQVWVNPCLYWSERDFYEYREEHNLPRNPVSEKLCHSHECGCNCFGSWEERVEVELHYPGYMEWVENLEAEVKAAGFDWQWHESPADAEKREAEANQVEMQLCSGCINTGGSDE